MLLLLQVSALNYIIYQRWSFEVLGLHELLRNRLELGALDEGCQLVKVSATLIKLTVFMTRINKVIFESRAPGTGY